MKYSILILCMTVFVLPAKAQVTYLDSTFNGAGIFRANHAGGSDVPSITLTRPNDKSLEIGISYFGQRNPVDPWNPEIGKPMVVQFDSHGLPDNTFGVNGVVAIDFFGNYTYVAGAALDPDGRLLIAGYVSGLGNLVFRLKEDGTFDTDFGTNGIAGDQFGIYFGWWNTVALQSDGKILLGGGGQLMTDPPGSNNNFLLHRLNSDGSIDESFGTGGFVYTDISMVDDNEILSIDAGPGSTITAGGSIRQGTHRNIMVSRYLENGEADISFGQNGMVIQPGDEGGAGRILTQSDGTTIIAGPSYFYFSDWGFVKRLKIDGTEDETFQNIITLGPVTGLIAGNDGTVLVSSFLNFGFFYPDSAELNILRYLPSGSVDPNFGGTIYLSSSTYRMDAGMGVQSDGKIMIGGFRRDAFFRPDYCLMRFSAAALPDTDYGVAGFATHNIGSAVSTAYSLLIDPQNRILVGGNAGKGFVTRLTANGILDNSFSGNGWSVLIIGDDPSHSIIAQKQDGKILSASGYYENFSITQLLPDGQPDTTFGEYKGHSTAFFNVGGNGTQVSAVSQQPDGKILVMGSIVDLDLALGKVAIVRFTANGLIDSSFADNGILITAPALGAYEVHAGILQPDGKILVSGGYYQNVGNTPETFLIRYLPDGSFDPDFGINGIVKNPFSIAFSFQTKGMALQADGRIVLCGSTGNATNRNSAIGRLNEHGIKDNSFSGDGIMFVNTGPFVESAAALAVQSDGKIVVAAAYTNNNDIEESDPVLIRLHPNGTLDSTFSENGYVVTDLPGDNEPKTLVINAAGDYMVAGFSGDDYAVIKYLSELKVDLVNTPSAENILLVYPNPVRGQLTLEYTLPESGDVSLEMFDLNGKMVHTFFRNEQKPQGENTAVMYIPAYMVPGAYMLRLQMGLGSAGIRIFVE